MQQMKAFMMEKPADSYRQKKTTTNGQKKSHNAAETQTVDPSLSLSLSHTHTHTHTHTAT